MTDKNQAMNKKTKSSKPPRSTVVYGKFFAFLGVLVGILLAFGTPGFLLANIHDREIRELVESLPDWAIPTLMCNRHGGRRRGHCDVDRFRLVDPLQGHPRSEMKPGRENADLSLLFGTAQIRRFEAADTVTMTIWFGGAVFGVASRFIPPFGRV